MADDDLKLTLRVVGNGPARVGMLGYPMEQEGVEELSRTGAWAGTNASR